MSSNTKPTLLLLDGHSLAFRAFYALPAENFATSAGQHTNAVYGFATMLTNLLTTWQPSHVAVAFDLKTPTFRKLRFPEYKATRDKAPEEFGGQVDLIQGLLSALGITVVTKEGFEADDVLATLSAQGSAAEMTTYIVTGDRDSIQLVDDHVTVLYPRKGTTDMDHLTPSRVEEKYGLAPASYPDMAALVGETSDNIPGVPKVGPKTAVKWLNQFGSLEALLDGVGTLKGVAAGNLAEMVGQVRMNRELNALVRDVELPVSLDSVAVGEPDVEGLRTKLADLEFRETMLSQLLEARGVSPEQQTSAPAVDIEVTPCTVEELGAYFKTLPDDEHCAVVIRDTTLVVGNTAGQCVSLDTADVDAAALSHVVELLSSHRVIVADSKAYCRELARLGFGPLDGSATWATSEDVAPLDLAVLAFHAEPGVRTPSVESLCERLAGVTIAAEDSEPQGELDLGLGDDSAPEEATVLATTAYAHAVVGKKLFAKVDAKELSGVVTSLDLPLNPLLARMEDTGIAVDAGVLADLEKTFSHRVNTARDDAARIVGRPINLNSPKQLGEVLFNEMDLPKTKKTKTGYSTNAEALADLYEKRPDNDFLRLIMEHREAAKLLGTVTGLQGEVRDGRIHTTFWQTVAATGRLSSSDPNLQNIPVRSEEGRRIREAFIPGDGYECLLSADYSQIEMRIMAHLCGDEALIDAFQSGEDLHAYVGSQVYGVAPSEVDAEMRSHVKAMSYGLAYGLSAYGLSRQLRISDAEAKALMDMYFARFGGVKTYLDEVVVKARADGYTETIAGRRRYLPDLNSSNRQRRDIAERAALNAPIQGSAADIMKIAMLRIDDALRQGDYKSRMLLQVHDEVIVEVAAGELDDVSKVVVECMQSAQELTVPLDVNTGHGSSWRNADH